MWFNIVYNDSILVGVIFCHFLPCFLSKVLFPCGVNVSDHDIIVLHFHLRVWIYHNSVLPQARQVGLTFLSINLFGRSVMIT